MKGYDTLMSSACEEWGTTVEFFKKLDDGFHFTPDPCASDDNHKCARYFTKETDGLKQDWRGETVFMNPPHGRGIGDWMTKAAASADCETLVVCADCETLVVCLVPARTDTKWFHSAAKAAREIVFIPGRLKFVADGVSNSAPFPSCLVVFGGMLRPVEMQRLNEFGLVWRR